MPGTVVAGTLKRKGSKSSENAKKRAKAESSSSEDESDHTDLLILEQEILESKKNYNNISVLLETCQIQDDDKATFAIVSLCRVFLRLLASGNLTRRSGQSEKDIVVIQWLKKRLGEYKDVIVGALGREALASTALTLAMRILKSESQHMSEKTEYSFPKVFLKDIVGALVQSSFEDVRDEFCEKYLGIFADIRYYTFKGLSELLSDESVEMDQEVTFENVFDMLSFFEDVPESNEDLGDFFIEKPTKKGHPVTSLHQQKRQAQDAWTALLKLEPNRDQRKKVLEIMTRSIAPWFATPELLMDFLTDSYNAGGATSLLALSGVFYLIQERNLDYPSFYRKLYSLLDANILHSKHRSRFFRLLDTFLASTHLPAVLVASFIKRSARLCLSAPPSAIVTVIPWIYNLFKKHPMCTFMMHRETRTQEERDILENEGMRDPFLVDEADPMETRAIDSCLWEIVQLQSHYHPNVATIAKIISEQFTKQSYNMEDFLDHSYHSLMDAELSKQVKKAPVVEYMIPKRVFLPQDDPSDQQQNTILARVWDFQ